jgi:hypothetical protein
METHMFFIMNGAFILAFAIWRRYAYKTLSVKYGDLDKKWMPYWILLIFWLNS